MVAGKGQTESALPPILTSFLIDAGSYIVPAYPFKMATSGQLVAQIGAAKPCKSR